MYFAPIVSPSADCPHSNRFFRAQNKHPRLCGIYPLQDIAIECAHHRVKLGKDFLPVDHGNELGRLQGPPSFHRRNQRIPRPYRKFRPGAPDGLAEDATATQNKAYTEAMTKHEEEMVLWREGSRDEVARREHDPRLTVHADLRQDICLRDLERLGPRMASVDLRHHLQDACCEENNFCAHFARIHNMRETLGAMGHALTDEDLSTMILDSLPASHDSNVSALVATRDLMADSKTLTEDELMLKMSDA